MSETGLIFSRSLLFVVVTRLTPSVVLQEVSTTLLSAIDVHDVESTIAPHTNDNPMLLSHHRRKRYLRHVGPVAGKRVWCDAGLTQSVTDGM